MTPQLSDCKMRSQLPIIINRASDLLPPNLQTPLPPSPPTPLHPNLPIRIRLPPPRFPLIPTLLAPLRQYANVRSRNAHPKGGPQQLQTPAASRQRGCETGAEESAAGHQVRGVGCYVEGLLWEEESDVEGGVVRGSEGAGVGGGVLEGVVRATWCGCW